MKYKIWEITAQGYPLLDNFLYKSIFVPDSVEPLSKELLLLLNCMFMLKISERQKMILY